MEAGSVQGAMQHWEMAAGIYRDIDDRLREAECHIQTTPRYMLQGDFETAMRRCFQTFVASSKVLCSDQYSGPANQTEITLTRNT